MIEYKKDFNLKENFERLNINYMMSMFNDDELEYIIDNYKNDFDDFYADYMKAAFQFHEDNLYYRPDEFLVLQILKRNRGLI